MAFFSQLLLQHPNTHPQSSFLCQLYHLTRVSLTDSHGSGILPIGISGENPLRNRSMDTPRETRCRPSQKRNGTDERRTNEVGRFPAPRPVASARPGNLEFARSLKFSVIGRDEYAGTRGRVLETLPCLRRRHHIAIAQADRDDHWDYQVFAPKKGIETEISLQTGDGGGKMMMRHW